MIYDNGAKYEGQWHRGVKQGIGRYEYPDGSVYEGEWVDNNVHG